MKISILLLLGLILELFEEITKNTNCILIELLFEQIFSSCFGLKDFYGGERICFG
jgi:hypothetical protein